MTFNHRAHAENKKGLLAATSNAKCNRTVSLLASDAYFQWIILRESTFTSPQSINTCSGARELTVTAGAEGGAASTPADALR